MQISKIRNEKGNITTDTEEIQRIFRSYFENLYSTKFGNSKKMNNLNKLNKEQISNLNRPITPNEIEAVIESLPTKKKASVQNSTRNSRKS